MDFVGFEDIIGRIEGVINSKIVAQDGEISEIHVLANTSRSPKQMSRDIETAIFTAYEYKVDRKLISIAQVRVDCERKLKRIIFQGISIATCDKTVECSVTLSYDEEEFTETQKGIKTSSNKRKIIAETTVSVVEKVLGQASVFDVQEVLISQCGGISFVSVLVNMITGANEEVLVGSAIIRNDENEAIVKAALDAINRRMALEKP